MPSTVRWRRDDGGACDGRHRASITSLPHHQQASLLKWQAIAMIDDFQDVLAEVGARLRRLRKAHQLTLDQLAEETGISASTLSRLESGQRRPNLELLLPLAKAYRVPLDELVGAPATGDPRVHPRSFRRRGVTWVQLAKNPGGPTAYKQVIGVSRGDAPAQDLCVHEGYEWAYVLSGEVQLTLGSQRYRLRSGEAAEFETTTPHGYANSGPVPVELLIIFVGQGERIHLRLQATKLRSED